MDSLQASRLANMDGLTALVTGGGTGIGLVIAKAFAANGAKVYITGRRLEVLEKAAAEVKSVELVLIPLQLDVTNKDSIVKAVEIISSKESKLDVLVNNAGISGPASTFQDSKPSGKAFGDFIFNNETFEGWHNVLATNTVAPFFMTMAFLGLLEKGAKIRSHTSSVINVSSLAGISRMPMTTYSYGMTKAALEHLTRCMATDFARREIPVRANSLVPGIFPSQLTGGSEDTADKLSQAPQVLDSLAPTPLKRAGRQEEMALAALYLASPGGGYSNGGALVVDGGWSVVNL